MKKNICVFGGSVSGKNIENQKTAKIIGKIIAENMIGEKTKELEAFEKIKHRNFPGGRLFRMPLLVTISSMQRMMDIFNV